MNPKADPAESRRESLLRQIPSVDELIARPRLAELSGSAGRGLVVASARAVLSELRSQIAHSGAAADPSELESRVAAEVEKSLALSLRPVINATGVVLHTNLGRATLSACAIAHLAATATQYSNLEYDLAAGERGKRDAHTSQLLAQLVGAESAIVVNNNAAAVFLVLNTFAKGADVLVSRGELIEIGDGFRIPEIMAESGAVLREIGTTNRTRIADYEHAISERTRLLLRVHPSNFRIVGFTERPSLEELIVLGRRANLPLFEDLGSGCLAELTSAGISEPVVRSSVAAGVPIVSFSGDKMLGGPQAGIIAGKKEFIDRIRRNPLFRALRVDKLTIAVLEVTLRAYLRGAYDEIPTLRMIRSSADEVERRARAFTEKFSGELPPETAKLTKLEIIGGFSVIGGGSTPDQSLPTHLIAVTSRRYSATQVEQRLRQPASGSPVIARIEDDRLVLDLRTVFPEQEPQLASLLATVLQ